MNQLIPLLIFCVASYSNAALATISDTPADVNVMPEVIRADFGLFNTTNSGKPVFVSAKVVPFVPNQQYGWVILLRTNKPNIKWREELTLPQKPITWGKPEPLDS